MFWFIVLYILFMLGVGITFGYFFFAAREEAKKVLKALNEYRKAVDEYREVLNRFAKEAEEWTKTS